MKICSYCKASLINGRVNKGIWLGNSYNSKGNVVCPICYNKEVKKRINRQMKGRRL